MNQHPIDLLPPQVRQRAQAGQRTGRSVALFGGSLLLLVVIVTHSKMVLDSAQSRLESIQREASEAVEIEKSMQGLTADLAEAEAYVKIYQQVASPIPMSMILATVINALPATATLDEILAKIDTGSVIRSARSRSSSVDGEVAPRRLRIELSGFAASDAEIAELVGRLRVIEPFDNVSLDLSRTRPIGGQHAREFRLSFQVDLEAQYVHAMSTQAEGVAHVAE